MEIQNWKDVQGHKSTVGEFDLYIPEWQCTFKRLKAVRTSKGNVFCGLPCYSEEVNGEKKYFPYISFSKERKDRFDKAVADLIKPYLNSNQY